MPCISATSHGPLVAIILALPIIALAGWYAGVWMYSQGFGSIPVWTLLMACVSMSAGFLLGRFAVPVTLVFSMALCASLDHVAGSSPHNSYYEPWMTALVYGIGISWVAVAFVTRHRKRVPQWLDSLGKRLS